MGKAAVVEAVEVEAEKVLMMILGEIDHSLSLGVVG